MCLFTSVGSLQKELSAGNAEKEAEITDTGSHKDNDIIYFSIRYPRSFPFELRINYKLEFARKMDLKSNTHVERLSPGYSRRLLNNMASLWQALALNDVEIVVANKRFSAHKCVLAAASPFFRAMFSSGMEEQNQKEINLHEVPANTFQTILSFMYTGCLNVDVDTCQDLLAVADMLGVEDVVEICSEYLISNITPQNCVGIYAFGEAHSLPHLKRQSELFVEKNFVDASVGEEFTLLDLKTVLTILGSERLHIERESQVLEAAVRWIMHDLPGRRKMLLQVLNQVRIKLISHRHLFEIIDSCGDQGVQLTLTKFASPLETFKSMNKCTEPRQNAKKYMFVIGGFSRNKRSFASSINTLDSVERYDVYSKTWQTFYGMSNPRSSHGYAIFDRKIVVAGGEDASLISDSVESFDPDENVWTPLPNMQSPRYGLALVSADDKLFAIGGYVGTEIGGNVEMLDSTLSEWKIVDGMPNPRFSLAAVEYEGLIYIAGGLTDLYMESAEFESYNPVTKEWCDLASLRTSRAYHSLVALNGFVYAVGGFNEFHGSLRSVERYSIEENKWEDVSSLEISRAGAGVTVLNKKIYVFGGRSQDAELLYGSHSFCSSMTLSSVECYDPARNLWSKLPDMTYERCETAAVVL